MNNPAQRIEGRTDILSSIVQEEVMRISQTYYSTNTAEGVVISPDIATLINRVSQSDAYSTLLEKSGILYEMYLDVLAKSEKRDFITRVCAAVISRVSDELYGGRTSFDAVTVISERAKIYVLIPAMASDPLKDTVLNKEIPPELNGTNSLASKVEDSIILSLLVLMIFAL